MNQEFMERLKLTAVDSDYFFMYFVEGTMESKYSFIAIAMRVQFLMLLFVLQNLVSLVNNSKADSKKTSRLILINHFFLIFKRHDGCKL